MPFEDGNYVPPSSSSSQKNDKSSNNLKRSAVGGSTSQALGRESQPLANEPSAGIGISEVDGGIDTQHSREVDEQTIYRRLKQSPEVLSLLQAVTDDVIGPGANFTYVGRNDRGKESIRRARRFWEQNRDTYTDAMIDQLVAGDLYVYKRQKDEKNVEEAAKRILRNKYSFRTKSGLDAGAKMVKRELKQNTDMFEIEELTHIPALTVRHVINEYGDITEFRQKVAGDEVQLPREQVIHDSYMNLNGKTYGFAPFMSLLTEIDMLANAKNHNAKVFQNAGVISKVFKLPDEGPNSQNFEMVKKTVSKYRELRNKHRDLVLTGDVEIEDLTSEGSQMEFRQLAKYVTNILAMAWGIPPTRVGVDIGGGGAGGRATQISHEGYFKRIKRFQRKHEALLNENLFEPVFNCRIDFNAPDVKHEIRTADRDMRKIEVAKQYAAMGLWGRDKVMDYLDLNRNELADNFDYEDTQETAAKLSGLQDILLQDEEAQGDTADDGRREMIRDGQQQAENPRDEV